MLLQDIVITIVAFIIFILVILFFIRFITSTKRLVISVIAVILFFVLEFYLLGWCTYVPEGSIGYHNGQFLDPGRYYFKDTNGTFYAEVNKSRSFNYLNRGFTRNPYWKELEDYIHTRPHIS